MKLLKNLAIRQGNAQKAFQHTVPLRSPRGALVRSPFGNFVFAFGFGNARPAAFGQSLATNLYTASSEEFANPERGFHIQADSCASAPWSITANLASCRIDPKSSPGNSFSAKISHLSRVFYLVIFTNAPIPINLLNSIQADFNSTRARGDKAVVRFAYNRNDTRPFGEPTRARNFPSNPAAGSSDADPDGDGRGNLLEYAVGSNPNVGESSGYLNVSYQTNALFLSLQKGLGAEDVNFKFESSPNLASASGSRGSVAIPVKDASLLRARSNGGSASGFLWLKFTLE